MDKWLLLYRAMMVCGVILMVVGLSTLCAALIHGP